MRERMVLEGLKKEIFLKETRVYEPKFVCIAHACVRGTGDKAGVRRDCCDSRTYFRLMLGGHCMNICSGT